MTVFGRIKKWIMGEKKDRLGLADAKYHQKVLTTDVYIFDKGQITPAIFRNKIILLIEEILPKIPELTEFPIIRMLVNETLSIPYFRFEPSYEELKKKIKSGCTLITRKSYTPAYYISQIKPITIVINVTEIYALYLNCLYEKNLKQPYIPNVSGFDRKEIKEILEKEFDEDELYKQVLIRSIKHELIHATQDQESKLLKINTRLMGALYKMQVKKEVIAEKSGGFLASIRMSRQVTESIEKFRMLLQIEGLAEYASQKKHKSLKENYDLAIAKAEEIEQKFKKFIETWDDAAMGLPMGLAGEWKKNLGTKKELGAIALRDIKSGLKQVPEAAAELKQTELLSADLSQLLESGAYVIGMHMIQVLCQAYNIEEITKMSRYRFIRAYMELYKELYEDEIFPGKIYPVCIEVDPESGIRHGTFNKEGILNLDNMKYKLMKAQTKWEEAHKEFVDSLPIGEIDVKETYYGIDKKIEEYKKNLFAVKNYLANQDKINEQIYVLQQEIKTAKKNNDLNKVKENEKKIEGLKAELEKLEAETAEIVWAIHEKELEEEKRIEEALQTSEK